MIIFNKMQYIFIFIAFLCEITVNPLFIKTPFSIESIFIAYFAVIILMQKKIPVVIPALLLIISSIITGEIPALNSFILLISSFLYCKIFLTRKQAKSYIVKPKQSSSIGIFMIILLIATLLKILILSIFGYTIVTQSEIFSYIFNSAIFIILTICTL